MRELSATVSAASLASGPSQAAVNCDGLLRSTSGHIYSQQLFSRFQLERDVHPRMLSTLARQLERYRDNLLVWRQQEAVASTVAERFAQELHARDVEVDRWKIERIRVDTEFNAQHDTLVRGLNSEIDKTRVAIDNTETQLEESLQQESQATQEYREQQELARKLHTTLAKTMAQLDEQQAQLEQQRQCAADWELKTKRVPEHARMRERIEEMRLEKEKIDAEKLAVEASIVAMQDDSSHFRVYTSRLEDFVQRCVVGSTRLPPNSAKRREASRLLRDASRIRLSMQL